MNEPLNPSMRRVDEECEAEQDEEQTLSSAIGEVDKQVEEIHGHLFSTPAKEESVDKPYSEDNLRTAIYTLNGIRDKLVKIRTATMQAKLKV